MYVIDKKSNRVSKVQQKTFSELGFKERKHLQEWIANEPSILGEELLVIQKEFDGFSDTKERLDLLALDKEGNLVVIENKLDDSGRDVTWQALKYASYCSSLTKEEIRQIYQEYLDKIGAKKTAEEILSEFYDEQEYDELVLNKGYGQRIILVAANFRKEVTSTVMWLMNYNIKIQCLKVTPYQFGENIFLNVEQIIPVKDTEEYVIKMAAKTQSSEEDEDKLAERYKIRLKFWEKHLESFRQKSDLFTNISPTKDNWIGTGIGISGGSYNFVVSSKFARVEVYFSRPKKEENKFIFDTLIKHKDEIEKAFGDKLVWERLDDKKAVRIKYQLDGVNLYDENDWDSMIEFMSDAMIRLHDVFDKYIQEVKLQLTEFLNGEV